MRLVQVMVPVGKREAVIDVLEKEGVDYVLSDETSKREYTAVVTFPLPTEAVGPVLAALREQGIEEDAYTVVLRAETVISRKFEQLEDRYAEEGDEEHIAREELVAEAESLAPNRRSFFVLTVLSSVVATAGLLLDSSAVIVGSMVIAPLVGPAMATGVGSVVHDDDLFHRGVRLQIVGGLLAVASAGAFAFLMQITGVVPFDATEVFQIDEVSQRLSPDLLSLVVALAAGAAGALSLTAGVSTAIVGVMIAAALVPPTAVVGIGIAWGQPRVVIGSAILVLVNFFSVNLAAHGVLWYTGYRPAIRLREVRAWRVTHRRGAVLLIAILLLSSFLGGVTYTSVQTASFEDRARTAAAEVVNDRPGTTLLSLEVTYEGSLALRDVRQLTFRRPDRIIVTVGHSPGVRPVPVADEIQRRLAAVTAETLGADPPTVQVRYVTVDTSGTETSVPPDEP